MENLELYKKLMRFLALYLGNNVEILLCDTEKILHTENPSAAATTPVSPWEMWRNRSLKTRCMRILSTPSTTVP